MTSTLTRRCLPALIAVAAVVCPSPARAQDSSFAEAWRWVAFTTRDGLPDDYVLTVEETGAIPWAVTEAGTAWYDGFRWHPVGPAQGLPAGRPSGITALGDTLFLVVNRQLYRGDTAGFARQPLAEDADPVYAVAAGAGRLILQLAEGGFAEYRNGTLRPLPDLPSASTLTDAPQVWRTRSGVLWINTRDGLYRETTQGWRRGPSFGTPEVAIGRIVDDPQGGALATVLHPERLRGIWTWGAGRAAARLAAEGQHITTGLTGLADGRVLATYQAGVARVRNGAGWRTVTGSRIPLTRAEDVRVRPDGDLWVSTRTGLFRYRASADRWHTHQFPFPDRRNRINDLLMSRDGDLWIATGNGVSIHEPDGTIRSIRRIGGTRLGEVTGVAQDTAGTIWITSGSSFAGAWRLDGRGWRHVGAEEGLRGRIHRVVGDGAGNLWFLELAPAPAAAVRYDGATFERRDDHEMLRQGVYAMMRDADGTLWFGVRGGLLRWRDGVWRAWTDEHGLTSAGVFTLARGPEGRLWFGRRQGGLGYVTADDSIGHLTEADGLVDDAVWELAAGEDGTLWIATSGGLAARRDGQWLTFNARTGLPNAYLWPVLPLADRIVIGTIGGLVELSRTEEADPAPRVRIDAIAVGGNEATLHWTVAAWGGRVPAGVLLTRHRVDGGAWSRWSSVRHLTLPDRTWGDHQVEVQAQGLFGQLSDPAVATVTIPLPLLFRPVFALPVGGLILALLWVGAIAAVRKRRHDDAVRASERRLRTIVEHAPEAMIIWDTGTGRFVDVNDRAVALFGRSREELLGLGPEGLSPRRQPDGTPSAELVRSYGEEVLAGGTPTFEWVALHADGREIPCEVRLVRLPGDRPLVRASIIDIGERVALDRQLRHVQKMEAMGELTGGIAHDFNNILTAVLVQADFVREGLPPEAEHLRSDLEGIHDMARRGAGLIRKLMAFARREPVDLRTLDLVRTVSDLLPVLRRVLPEHIAIDFDCADPEDELWIRGEGGSLEQILLNLATNARDAMPNGGKLRVEVSATELSGEDAPGLAAGPYARLVVRDTGHGMDEDTRRRVFDPFFTTKEAGRGTGLGLAVVYGLVTQQGGALELVSTPGKGTAVTLLFPRHAAASRPGAAEDPPPLPSGTERVLIVEDEPSIRSVAQRLLERKGYVVETAEDGAAALAMLTDAPRRAALVITDVVMPKLGGWSLYQEARRAGCAAKFLFMSGYTARDGAAPDIDPGLPFLRKPWTAGEFLEKVRAVLDGRA